jgi:hypothetical protein
MRNRSRVQYLQSRAAELRDKARAAVSETLRRELDRMAAEYDRLAAHALQSEEQAPR